MELAAIERRKAELKLKRAEKGLSAMRVVAPHDGILVFPMNWRGEVLNIGDSAWPGQTVAEIPDLSLLQSAGVGLVSGIYPATRAAGLDPIESLRYE